MTKLEEELGLPEIGGKIVAEFFKASPFDWDPPEERVDRFDWSLAFCILGPDARYNAGRATVKSKEVPALLEQFLNAMAKMRALQSTSFSGEFSKEYNELHNPTLELKSSGGESRLHFWVSNDTRWRFCKTLNLQQVEQVVKILKSVDQRGNQLVVTYRALHD